MACGHLREPGKKCSCAGSWEVRWREPQSGRRRSASTPSFNEARALKVSRESELQAGTYRSPDAGRIKFSDYVDRWFGRQRHLAGGTRDRDASHIENHLKPKWGNYELADITIEEVEDWVLALDESYARKTVLDIYGIFRRSMDYAVERRLRLSRKFAIFSKVCVIAQMPPAPAAAIGMSARNPNGEWCSTETTCILC